MTTEELARSYDWVTNNGNDAHPEKIAVNHKTLSHQRLEAATATSPYKKERCNLSMRIDDDYNPQPPLLPSESESESESESKSRSARIRRACNHYKEMLPKVPARQLCGAVDHIFRSYDRYIRS